MYFIIKKTLPCISQPGHPAFSCLIICATNQDVQFSSCVYHDGKMLRS